MASSNLSIRIFHNYFQKKIWWEARLAHFADENHLYLWNRPNEPLIIFHYLAIKENEKSGVFRYPISNTRFFLKMIMENSNWEVWRRHIWQIILKLNIFWCWVIDFISSLPDFPVEGGGQDDSRTFRHRTFRHRKFRHNHLVTRKIGHKDIWQQDNEVREILEDPGRMKWRGFNFAIQNYHQNASSVCVRASLWFVVF